MVEPVHTVEVQKTYNFEVLAECLVMRRFCWTRFRMANIVVYPQALSQVFDDRAVGICGVCGGKHVVSKLNNGRVA